MTTHFPVSLIIVIIVDNPNLRESGVGVRRREKAIIIAEAHYPRRWGAQCSVGSCIIGTD